MSILFVGGGSRTDKSKQALVIARRYGVRRGFLATAQVFDLEMEKRISKHHEERGREFETFEEPLDIASVVSKLESRLDVLVIDCLTLWLSNVMHVGPHINLEKQLDRLAASPLPCVLVTNEVGSGIVPENALAREFRDRAGILNQAAMERAVEAYWTIFWVVLKFEVVAANLCEHVRWVCRCLNENEALRLPHKPSSCPAKPAMRLNPTPSSQQRASPTRFCSCQRLAAC